MLVLKRELDIRDFEIEFSEELHNLPYEAIEIIFYTLSSETLYDDTVLGVRDYLRFQMQVRTLKEVIHSYGYMMNLQDLDTDQLIKTVTEFLHDNTYLLGTYEQDGEMWFIFDEF